MLHEHRIPGPFLTLQALDGELKVSAYFCSLDYIEINVMLRYLGTRNTEHGM